MNLESARSHFREIENLVYEMAKMIGRSLYALDRLDLSGSKFSVYALPQQVHKTDNCI